MNDVVWNALTRMRVLLAVYGIRIVGGVLMLDALFEYGVTWMLPRYPHQSTFALGLCTYIAGSTAMRAVRGHS